jgi:hypothetical protein
MTLERRLLLNREVQSSDDAIRTVELSRNSLVSALALRVEITNGATAGEEEIWDAIDRIEVRGDGSDILFSLTGPELHRWQWVWNRQRPNVFRTGRASAVQDGFFLIPFGRGLNDGSLYLPTSRWNRVEARIDYSPTISATTFATATVTLTLVEYSWAEGNAPGPTLGWLRTRQVRDFTSLASGDERIELDRAHPYMGLLVYAREAAIAEGVDITVVEVTENDGRIVPFTGNWLDWQEENALLLDIDGEEHKLFLVADNANMDMHVGRIVRASVVLEQDYTADAAGTGQIAIASVTADRLVLASIDEDFTAAAPISALNTGREAIHTMARGIGIGQAVFIPLARPGDVENPYPAPDKSKVELLLTQGGAGATVRVSTQELVRG